MTPIQQLMLGVGAKKKTYMDDVFHTQLFTTTTINADYKVTNNIDNSGEGGLVWYKDRIGTSYHMLFDTARGSDKYIYSNATSGQNTSTQLKSFDSDGYTFKTGTNMVNPARDAAVWNFRKAPGFFDIVTWTGNSDCGGSGIANQTISHSLGCVPGMIIVKRTDDAENWISYHRGVNGGVNPENYGVFLNLTSAKADNDWYWNDTAPTSSSFVVNHQNNICNATYVAYLFAGGESSASEARSVEFDGAEDSLLIETNSDLALGTGDFTIEFWVKPQTLGYAIFFDMRPNPAATQGAYPTIYMENDILRYYTNSGTQITGNALSKDQWQHIALSRSGTSTKMFVNGTQVGSTYSDSTNYLNGDTTIGLRADGSTGDFDGYISNLRVVKGTAVYTSSFRPPTEPLTNITNTKLLCCNNSSTTGSTVTPSTITATGTTASTDSPFDDPAGFVFGESGSENVIKCGSYKGSGSAGLEVNVGWEPSWLMVKATSRTGDWYIMDSMRGVVTSGNDEYVKANESDAEGSADVIEFTSTGFKVISTGTHWNNSAETYSFTAIRRSDGYCGKPPALGSGCFAMDTGSGSSTIPNFDSGFPVDFTFARTVGGTANWDTGARLIQGKYINTNSTGAEGNASNMTFDSNVGWNSYSSWGSGAQSWMWKRHAGFDCIAYKGDDRSGGRPIKHNLSVTPEMMWIKVRNNATQPWVVYHKDVGHGKYLRLNTNNAETNNIYYLNNTAPTSTAFTVGQADYVNGNYNYLAILFASVSGISAVGNYSGSGSTGNAQNIGFQPRFLIIKRTNSTGDWMQFNSVGGFGKYMQLNTTQQQNTQTYVNVSSTGFSLVSDYGDTNESGSSYVYYAHA